MTQGFLTRRKLFDKWVANPQSIEELRGFDEYLSRDTLDCLVEGCGWSGRHLAVHLNVVHGIRAREFKQMVGFNLTSSLIAPDLRRNMKLMNPEPRLSREEFLLCVAARNTGKGRGYISKESLEHREKARALRRVLKKQEKEKEE